MVMRAGVTLTISISITEIRDQGVRLGETASDGDDATMVRVLLA